MYITICKTRIIFVIFSSFISRAYHIDDLINCVWPPEVNANYLSSVRVDNFVDLVVGFGNGAGIVNIVIGPVDAPLGVAAQDIFTVIELQHFFVSFGCSGVFWVRFGAFEYDFGRAGDGYY